MSRKPLYVPMMETIKPYRDKLIQAKKQLDGAWNGEATSQPVVTSSQPDDVLELRENLSRVSIHWLVPSLLSANFAILLHYARLFVVQKQKGLPFHCQKRLKSHFSLLCQCIVK